MRRAARGGRIGVLIVNLGTPDAADAPAVRRYLREFLTDPRVIENQGLVWKFVLNGIILPLRPRVKGRDYQKIWNRERNESPLKTITRAQAEKLRATIEPLDPTIMVDWAMRYGNPSLERAHRGAGQGRLRAHPADAALSAICRGDHRDGLRRRVSDADQAARPAGAARRAALLRRPGLYRGAGVFDRGRAARGCRSSPR